MMEAALTQPALAFAAGLLTVAAPCVLPLLPVVLGATAAGGPGARPVFIAAGFALSFTALALVFESVQHLLGLEQQTVRDVAALLLVAFGLCMVWPSAFQRLSATLSGVLGRAVSIGDRAGAGWVGGLLVGISLGAVWTPCAGPVLATILTLVAAQADWGTSAALLGLYALGAALPMLAIAYGGQWMLARVRTLTRHTHRLQQTMGVVVTAVGLLTFLQYDTLVTLWLSGFYPSFSTGL
ncbi:cytochrome c biogenesis CcdA family protein [Paucibacter sp. PLA-PC-4]|uniref:cytochrome c biogenesis CcdA family protein n=1 Tax=Paucibacter sp. PLA-PC-4 TaxID=2993655 RepID=UPI00224ADE06|nr:cytochrome c biogenesis CcdA family protein [Paucibacter sp. PLA-PC-4]MCX2864128.1 cytochrome c biogenesis CcdA family protein [Paucibacter sp. PLA-PC-4]